MYFEGHKRRNPKVSLGVSMVGAARIELATPAMSTQCSPAELRALFPAFRTTYRTAAEDRVLNRKTAVGKPRLPVSSPKIMKGPWTRRKTPLHGARRRVRHRRDLSDPPLRGPRPGGHPGNLRPPCAPRHGVLRRGSARPSARWPSGGPPSLSAACPIWWRKVRAPSWVIAYAAPFRGRSGLPLHAGKHGLCRTQPAAPRHRNPVDDAKS